VRGVENSRVADGPVVAGRWVLGSSLEERRDPEGRKKRLDAAVDLIARGLTGEKAARANGISRATLYRWVAEAITYEEEPGPALARMVARIQPKGE
jgi:transposase-like protein